MGQRTVANRRVRTINPILIEAIRYAERGFHVHPVNGKRPYLAKWPERASIEVRQLEEWWKEFPDANVAIVTGSASGIVVIDVDNKKGISGEVTLRALQEKLGGLPPTLTARTPHGVHYYFSYPDAPIQSSVGRLGEGIDVRSDLRGSAPVEDRPGGISMADVDPAALPEAWLKLLAGGQQRAASEIPSGSRNDTVFREACRLRARNVPRDQALAELREFNATRCEPPLDDREVLVCLKSAWRYRPNYELNDRGNAQRFVSHVDGRVRYVIERRTFIYWPPNGHRWIEDQDDLECMALMKESNERIWDEARMCVDEKRKSALARFALIAQNTPKVRSSLDSVKSEPDIKFGALELDADPYLLGVENGVVELRTGKFRSGRREDLITKSMGCAYDRDAKCPRWLKFLDQITGSDPEFIRYLQLLVGYSLTGEMVLQILLFVFGPGATGKTIFLETVKSLFGTYARNLRTEILMSRPRGGGASEDEARLFGARFVTVNETADGMRFNSALVKDLTGGDTITARRLYENSFEFRPQFTLWMRGNTKPEFNGEDDGMGRRIKLIPFSLTIPPAKRDEHLREKLARELPGILNWAIEGCLKWQRDELHEPAVVKDATADYISEMDSLGTFVDEWCVVDPERFIAAGRLYAEYTFWCGRSGLTPVSTNRMAELLKRLGCRSTRLRIDRKPSRVWAGIDLKRLKPKRRDV